MSFRNLISAGFKTLLLALAISQFAQPGQAQDEPPLLAPETFAVIASELSGEAAKRNLEFISLQHRMRGSEQFHAAAVYIRDKLIEYGYENAEILQFPTDGKIFYGTQRSRLAWDVEFAELWEMEERDGAWRPKILIGDWKSDPIRQAQDSSSADVTAELIDVGAGTSDADYEGKEVAGKLVLVSSQPGAVADLAIQKYGAVGIISYAPNQKTAWWLENENLIRWGHLASFPEFETFGFMLSLKEARAFSARLAAGETIMLHAIVEAGQSEGFYDIATASIAGADPVVGHEEVAFTCHLDHPRPGANDNASGCATILEVARTLKKLVDEGKVEPPKRTIRFIWPPEIEGSVTILNARPDLAQNIKAVVHMDMVGGGPETKAVSYVSRTPMSLPTFINNISESIADFVNDQTNAYAGGEEVAYPLVAQDGGKEAYLAVTGEFSLGSDHQVFFDSSFSIPAISLHQWPDRYIHTNFDTAAMIDPSRLLRSAFIGATSAYYLANFSDDDVPGFWSVARERILLRAAEIVARQRNMSHSDAANLSAFFLATETAALGTLEQWAAVSEDLKQSFDDFLAGITLMVGEGIPYPNEDETYHQIYRRNPEIKGPVSVFGYNYLSDHYGADRAAKLGLLSYTGPEGIGGGTYAYEAINFADGKRTVGQIAAALSAEFGHVPDGMVAEYLAALAEAGLLLPEM